MHAGLRLWPVRPKESTHTMLNHCNRFLAAPVLALLFALVSPFPVQANAPAGTPQGATESLVGTVMEQFEAGGYTYVRLNTESGAVWAAGPQVPMEKGTEVSVDTSMPMRNFHSKALDRTFDLIYFVDGFGTEEETYQAVMSQLHGEPGAPRAAPEPVTPAPEGNTVAEVLEQPGQFAGKTVRIRARVTRFNPQIMGTNWLHIEDGSGAGDLTVTSDDEAAEGDIVVVEGVIALDRDFGHGYVYPVIIEGAQLHRE